MGYGRVWREVGGLACVLTVVATILVWVMRVTAAGLARVGRPVPRDRPWFARAILPTGVGVGVAVAGGLVAFRHGNMCGNRNGRATLVHMAILSKASGDYKTAEEACGFALARAGSAEVYLLRAETLVSLGEPDRALRDIAEAIRLRPADGGACLLRASIHEKKGDSVSAQQDRDWAAALGRRSQ